MVELPAVGSMRPSSIRKVVVLPAPFGPRNPVMLPWATSKLRLSTATTFPKRLVRPCIWMEVMASLCGADPASTSPLRQVRGSPFRAGMGGTDLCLMGEDPETPCITVDLWEPLLISLNRPRRWSAASLSQPIPPWRSFWRSRRLSSLAATYHGIPAHDHACSVTVSRSPWWPSTLALTLPVGLARGGIRSRSRLSWLAGFLIARIVVHVPEANVSRSRPG